MATNVKKWTDRLWIKILCLALSLLLFGSVAGLTLYTAAQAEMFGQWITYSKEQKKQLQFTDSYQFSLMLEEDLERIAEQTGSYKEQMLRQEVMAQLNNCTTTFLEEYNDRKADFILGYMFDSLCGEDIYENYDSYFEMADVSVPQVTIEKRVLVDAYAPEFVQKLQKIINGTDGQGFLRYADLIPTEVLAAQEYSHAIDVSLENRSFSWGMEYHLALNNPSQYFKEQFESMSQTVSFTDFSAEDRANIPASLRYYIADHKTGESFTNVTDATEETFLKEWKDAAYCFSIVSGVLTQKGLDQAADRGTFDHRFNDALDVYVMLDINDVSHQDKYLNHKIKFDEMVSQSFGFRLGLMLLLGAGALALLILLMVITSPCRKWIDRIPLELHFAVTAVACWALIAVGWRFLEEIGYLQREYAAYLGWFYTLFIAAAMIGWALIAEFLCSLVRICKAGQLSHSFLLSRIGRWLGHQLLSTIGMVRDVFGYQPGTMRKYVIALIGAWGAVDVLLIFLMVVTDHLLLTLIFMALQFVMAYKAALYLRQLDEIILAAQNRQAYEGDIGRLPASLRALVQSQKYTQNELNLAIEKAVKDERTKAELITNVSHDLKTPLTSVINYIDLLQRCDIPDERAKEYLEVLSEKSGRLKRLIEDLIEASKVTTGNITLQKTQFSLNELANQAIVEETEDLEDKGLTLIYNALTSPIVYADGSKIYRVLENLLTNARKYSLQGSRVYASVYEDEAFGYFELKNTSKDPLDISPQELTERFVRGDRSRSAEGNGLGLSIASNLCRLNGGELILSIDGDLLKAIVKLPKN